jgi:hypothetical protein
MRPLTRRLLCSGTIVAIVVLGLVMPVSAATPKRERLSYHLEFVGSVACDTFDDNYLDIYDIREIDVFASDGNLVKIVYHITHTSNDVNSVTGFTLHEHGQYTETDDFLAGTYTLTGNLEVANRNGTGVVIQDTGRVVYDANFEPIFFAGGQKHSQFLLGEGIWCDALG